MEHDLANRLHEAVYLLNDRAEQARVTGLPFVLEAKILGKPDRGAVHLAVLRSIPPCNLPPDMLEEQCSAEIALLSAAEEVNRLATEAWRRNLSLQLRVEPAGGKRGSYAVELICPALQ